MCFWRVPNDLHHTFNKPVSRVCARVCLCSDPDGGYMDMNKDESVQYVTMKECSHQEETLLYETPYTATGNDTCACVCVHVLSVLCLIK